MIFTNDGDGDGPTRHCSSDMARRVGMALKANECIGLAAAAAALILACASAGAAQAQNRGAVFTGGEVDGDDAGYLGGQFAWPGAQMGKGLGIRASVSGGRYEYSRNAASIEGDFVGVQAGPIYQWSGAWGYVDAGVSARYMHTSLDPYDPQNRRRGSIGDALFSVDGARIVGPWQATGYAEAGTGIQDYLVRASLTHTAGPRLRLGVESIFQGDPTYDRRRFGLLAARRFGGTIEVQLSGGLSEQRGQSDHAYATVAIVRSF